MLEADSDPGGHICSMKQTIRTFIGRFIRTTALGDEDDMFEMGFLNSLFFMQLVLWMEKTFEIAVLPEDMEIANFYSIDAISRFVGRKRENLGRNGCREPIVVGTGI